MESLPIASPDFTSLESSLKNYLKSRPELSDYDFDGSVLSTIVGLLAYNSTMNAYYLNQVANEAFLETASQRNSVVMNAQDLGYEVGSKTAAYAYIQLTLTEAIPSGNTFVTMPAANAVFSASVNNAAFTFRSLNDVYLTKDASGKFVADVLIYEGKQFEHNISVTQDILDNGYLIPNAGIDTKTIQIWVNNIVYEKVVNIVAELGGSSKVFFVSDSFGKTKITFGDGIIGRKPIIGESIKIKYLKPAGDLANGIGTFSMVGSYAGYTSATETIVAASGGTGEETIASIKFNAPKWFESQGRCVTAEDYRVIATKLFSNISDIIVWGGEDNEPPVYGKVFLSIKPYSGYYLTTADKLSMVAKLKKYNVVTVQPEIIDPDYVYVDIAATVEYKQSETMFDQVGIAGVVKTAVQTYATTELGKFSTPIRYSRIVNVMLDSDTSIKSVKFSTFISKHITPVVGGYSDIALDFKNPIKPGTLISSKFTFNNYSDCKFIDDGFGVIKIVESGTLNVINPTAGTIDYTTGLINISRTYLVSTDQTLKESTGIVYMNFNAQSSDLDINTTQRNILVIDKVTVAATKV
jgi:hypothetical protein